MTSRIEALILDLLNTRGPSGLEVIRRKTRAPRRQIDAAITHLITTGAIEECRSPRGGRYWTLAEDTPTPEGNES